MDISQTILVIIIILGLALAAGAVIYVSGGWIRMARSARMPESNDEPEDEDQPPPMSAWTPGTWYSGANEGTLFPNQPSPSFRLSADTSFHRAIALRSQDAEQHLAIDQENGTEASAQASATADGMTQPAASSQLTLPMPRVSADAAEATTASIVSPMPYVVPVSPTSAGIKPAVPMVSMHDPIVMAPTHPLPPLVESPARPLIPAKPTIPTPILAEEEPISDVDDGIDALTHEATIPALPTFGQANLQAIAATITNVTDDTAAADFADTDEQPTLTGLPTMPMLVAPVKDNLPPTLKLRSLRRPIATRPLPENSDIRDLQYEEPTDSIELAESAVEDQPQETFDDTIAAQAEDEAAIQDDYLASLDTEEMMAIPQAATPPLVEAVSQAGPGFMVMPPLAENISTAPAVDTDDAGDAEEAWPAVLLVENAAEEPSAAVNDTAIAEPASDANATSDAVDTFDTADWPAIIMGQQMAIAADETGVAGAARETEPAALTAFEEKLFAGDADVAGGASDVLASSTSNAWPNQVEHSVENATGPLALPPVVMPIAYDLTATSNTANGVHETEEQRYERSMVEAYSDAIRVRYEDDLDAVLIGFAGCTIKESADVAWVFKALSAQMQELFAPETTSKHAMLFDVAGLELAPEVAAAWNMVLDAYVSHTCPEVAPEIVLAVQYNSLDDAFTIGTDSLQQADAAEIEAASTMPRSIGIAHSFAEAIRVLQERRRAATGN